MADKLVLDRQAMKDRATAHLRVYVGGLTESATIDELYEHFIAYGEVVGIVINRGFGFVQFVDEASAQKAINMGDGSVFQGKSLNVRTAQTNTAQRRDDYPEKPPPMDYPASEETEDYNEGYPGEEEYGDAEAVRGTGRGGMRGGRGRGPGRGAPFRERSPVAGRGPEWKDRMSFDRFARPDYPRALPVPERNDCEIIVVSKALTEYAEYIEDRLKRLGIVVDLLFPMEHVAIGKVLGNIASRGCLYAILVMPENQEHRSLTLTILHGLPQEHRDMPIEDALRLMSRNFQEVQRGGAAGREAVQALLGQLADGRPLTTLQYEKVIDYLKEKKEQQKKIELGEPTAPLDKQVDLKLQQRILTILDKKAPPSPPPAPEQNNKLLNDPSVRKALDSILQKFV